MVEGWVRGGQALGYGWVVVRVGWVYGVGQEGRDEGSWVGVGLAYGGGVGRDWGVYGCFVEMGSFGLR